MTTGAVASLSARSERAAFGRGTNWALWLGGLFVAVFVGLAGVGPGLAPRDPLQENFIVPSGETFVKPPFAPLTVPDFPLGADDYGRDILSRLLWAVRPTLILVGVVAGLRLSIGLLAGLASGWSSGRLGRGLDWLIALALSVPVLFVALIVIAATGQRLGVQAFLLGLAITGWAETARTVREQTRLIKGQRYVESARALGASDWQIISRHVLPHLLPLTWILLSLEASSALLTTAALGFLGYFTNAVWIPLGDYTGIRASGYPDLGQLLTFSAASRQPWSPLAAGALVVAMVLGLNLLGDGLREALSPERRHRSSWLTRPFERAGGWVEDRLFFTEWPRVFTLGGAALALLTLILGGGWWLYTQTVQAEALANAIQIPGGHQWAAQRRDAQGTYWTPAIGPREPEVVWTFAAEGSYVSSPVIAADGTLYVVTGAATPDDPAATRAALVALDPQGRERWRAELPFSAFSVPIVGAEPGSGGQPVGPVGAPALTSRGDVVVASNRAGLAVFTPQGRLLWALPSQSEGQALVSPIVGLDDTIYLATELHLIAVTADGQRLWRTDMPSYSYLDPILRLSADGRYLLFQDSAVDARTGRRAFSAPISLDMFIAGADGQLYVRSQAGLDEWDMTETGAKVTQRVRLPLRSLGIGFRANSDAGVLPDGRNWVLYSTGFDYPMLVWTDASGQTPTVINTPLAGGQVLAIDGNAVTYMCGRLDFSETPGAECRAYRSDGEMAWKLPLPGSPGFITGAALTDGRLYVATGEGGLLAIGERGEGGAAAVGPAAPNAPSPTRQQPTSTQTASAFLTKALTATAMPIASATTLPTSLPPETGQTEGAGAGGAPPATPCPNPYVVQRGDWLYKIARQCGLSPSALIAANPGINPSRLVAGLRLNLPGATPTLEATLISPTSACQGIYMVKPGDNLFRLAFNCGLTTEQLARVNDLPPPYTIYPGQTIKFP